MTALAACDSLESSASGEGCLATNGNDCTLVVGVVLWRLSEIQLSMRVSDMDAEGEYDPAADVGLDCATPP